MKLRNNAVKVLSALLPAGVMGMSAALAATPPNDGVTPQVAPTAAVARVGETDVADRLARIRDAVSAVAAEGAGEATPEKVRTAWWGNFRGGRFGFGGLGGWGNGGWHNWGNGGWGNGGWGNGGWHNWGNGWHNGWHNW